MNTNTLPPPPLHPLHPPPPASPSSPSYPARQLQQRAQAPPAIYTNVPAAYTPASAVPGSAVVASASRPFRISPSSAMSYNPQEWGRAGQVSGAYVPHTAAAAQARARGTREMTGMEPQMPEPPPPYSASSSPAPHPSAHAHNSPHAGTFSPAQTSSPTSLHEPIVAHTPLVHSNRLSTFLPPTSAYPQQAPPTSFPPPPPSGTRDRSGSRTRGVLSSISAITSRHRAADPSPAPPIRAETYPVNRGDVLAGPQPLAHRPAAYVVPDPALPPPSARRSVSVGLVGTAADPSRGSSRDRSASNWQPGMPLPPPPPGGPPGSRSQSADRSSERSESTTQSIAAPMPQRSMGTLLSPVPATPADWRDEPVTQPRPPLTEVESQAQRLGLSLDTDADNYSHGRANDELSIMSAVEPRANQANSSAMRDGFGRMAPQRDSSTKGIRERRIESRSRIREPQTAIEPNNVNPWSDDARPANLVLASTTGGMISRRRHVPKSNASPRTTTNPMTPLSPRDAPDTGNSLASDMGAPRSATLTQMQTAAPGPTPPFSPESDMRDRSIQALRTRPEPSTPATLPTPNSATLNSGKSLSSDKQFYTPLEKSSVSPSSPIVASHLPATNRASSQTSHSPLTPFAQASLDRYRTFLEREAASSDDMERIELFAAFFVSESQLRRDAYSKAFESMGSDVLDLTRDLWRSSSKRGKAPVAARVDTRVASTVRSETPHQDPSSASSAGGASFTPKTEPDSPSSISSTGSAARNQKQQQPYQPCLSPILSMAMTSLPDEEDSRGRAPSRWWEQSDEAQSVGNPNRRIERSKRESKYMGLPRENLENMQWDNEPLYPQAEAGPSNYQTLGPNEYPPEKVGWHEESTPSALAAFTPKLRTPQPPKLDVSRLITLPPPYPRHHPAVNNSHPELAALRSTLRTLTETPEMEDFQARFDAERNDFDVHGTEHRRRDMLRQIQQQIAEGSMSYADAANAESGFAEQEAKRLKSAAKSNHANYQRDVLHPLSAILKEKESTATQSIDVLRTSLIDSTSTHNPNVTQESGDELPELLEKITLMKWLFEAREHLYKLLFDLQSSSDQLYSHVILAPYRATANAAKISEVSDFFASDRRARDLVYAQEILKRFEEFKSSVEDSVTRGVEAQLSAFWDIAPPLLEVVDKVPLDADRFAGLEIVIPPAEVAENPSYAEFPLQYLYSLVAHAEKSAYQLIESQTNLLCLLHEVKTGVVGANLRVLQRQREKARPGAQLEIEAEMQRLREAEDGRLTRDLKERVQLVEEQWRGALGSAMGDCRKRVGRWLGEVGGWDESLEE